MSSFLERYERGEHERVWDELLALGAAVREEPHSADALAVARETMRRARHNIERLILRLESLGFAFGYDWVLQEEPPAYVKRRPALAAGWRGWVVAAQHDYCTYRPPQPDAQERIAELERQTATLPLSLRAWYEVVGTVDLVGKPPPSWTREALGYALPDVTAEQELRARFAAAAGSHGVTDIEYHRLMRQHAVLWHAAHDWDVYLDPLLVLPVEVALAESVAGVDDMFKILVAPEGTRKWFQGDGDPYSIMVPNPAADAELINEWHGSTFVTYLRKAFQWGGFPGLARAAHPPLADLAYLREELLPM
jgi:hypothetical protein